MKTDKMEYYIKKLEDNTKLSYLRFFHFPKNSFLFILMTIIVFNIVQDSEFIRNIKFLYYGIPCIAIFMLWEYLICLSVRIKIAEECIVEECMMEQDLKENEVLKQNFPNDPLYVTEDDRDDIIHKYVLEHRNVKLIDRIISFKYSLALSIILYFIGKITTLLF